MSDDNLIEGLKMSIHIGRNFVIERMESDMKNAILQEKITQMKNEIANSASSSDNKSLEKIISGVYAKMSQNFIMKFIDKVFNSGKRQNAIDNMMVLYLSESFQKNGSEVDSTGIKQTVIKFITNKLLHTEKNQTLPDKTLPELAGEAFTKLYNMADDKTAFLQHFKLDNENITIVPESDNTKYYTKTVPYSLKIPVNFSANNTSGECLNFHIVINGNDESDLYSESRKAAVEILYNNWSESASEISKRRKVLCDAVNELNEEVKILDGTESTIYRAYGEYKKQLNNICEEILKMQDNLLNGVDIDVKAIDCLQRSFNDKTDTVIIQINKTRDKAKVFYGSETKEGSKYSSLCKIIDAEVELNIKSCLTHRALCKGLLHAIKNDYNKDYMNADMLLEIYKSALYSVAAEGKEPFFGKVQDALDRVRKKHDDKIESNQLVVPSDSVYVYIDDIKNLESCLSATFLPFNESVLKQRVVEILLNDTFVMSAVAISDKYNNNFSWKQTRYTILESMWGRHDDDLESLKESEFSNLFSPVFNAMRELLNCNKEIESVNKTIENSVYPHHNLTDKKSKLIEIVKAANSNIKKIIWEISTASVLIEDGDIEKETKKNKITAIRNSLQVIMKVFEEDFSEAECQLEEIIQEFTSKDFVKLEVEQPSNKAKEIASKYDQSMGVLKTFILNLPISRDELRAQDLNNVYQENPVNKNEGVIIKKMPDLLAASEQIAMGYYKLYTSEYIKEIYNYLNCIVPNIKYDIDQEFDTTRKVVLDNTVASIVSDEEKRKDLTAVMKNKILENIDDAVKYITHLMWVDDDQLTAVVNKIQQYVTSKQSTHPGEIYEKMQRALNEPLVGKSQNQSDLSVIPKDPGLPRNLWGEGINLAMSSEFEHVHTENDNLNEAKNVTITVVKAKDSKAAEG